MSTDDRAKSGASSEAPIGSPPDLGDDSGTLSGDIRRLRARGFRHAFAASTDGLLRCPSCGDVTEPAAMQVEGIVRYEGDSNPDDEAILVALSCPCGTLGYFTSAFGSAASAADGLVLARFT